MPPEYRLRREAHDSHLKRLVGQLHPLPADNCRIVTHGILGSREGPREADAGGLYLCLSGTRNARGCCAFGHGRAAPTPVETALSCRLFDLLGGAFLGLCLLPFRTRLSMQLEILALRHQLNGYRRAGTKPRLKPADRLFGTWLSRVWSG